MNSNLKLEQTVTPVLRYDVRNITPPGSETQTFYPVIVEDLKIDTMEDIVKSMEDTGRVPGLRAVAVKGLIDPAVLEQCYRCLMLGYSVDFGTFFIRLYMEGTTNPSGTISAEENSISAEFIMKEGYDIDLDQFKLSFTGSEGDKPVLTMVTSNGEISAKGVIGQTGSVQLMGNYLTPPTGYTTAVYLRNKATDETYEVTDISLDNDCLINFTRPAAVVAGGDYELYVAFVSNETATIKASKPLNVKIIAMPNPHVMSSIQQPEQEAGIITWDETNKPVVTGEDLGDPTAVWIDVYPDGYDAGADLDYRLDDSSLEEITSTATTISFKLFDNHSHHAGRDFKGKLARVWASYADGFKSYVNCQFHT